MKERFACQRSVILARHALAVMPHGHEGDDFGHRGLIIPNEKIFNTKDTKCYFFLPHGFTFVASPALPGMICHEML